ncbi:MAG: PAS domain-containing protein [Alkalinema sp. RU_4_3]|nr:PAS domain-containing protein [Alkalinema sp. RU_4_3]
MTQNTTALRFQSVQPIVQRALQALQLHGARYALLADTHGDCILRFLPDGKITYANLAFAQHCDRTPAEIVGQHLWSLLSRSDGATVLEQLQLQLKKLSPKHRHQTYELRSVRAGQVYWHEWRLSALLNSRSQLVEVQVVVRDITAQKQLAAATQTTHLEQQQITQLQAQVAQLQAQLKTQLKTPAQSPTDRFQETILDTLQEAVLIVQADGQVRNSNLRAREFWAIAKFSPCLGMWGWNWRPTSRAIRWP